MGVLRNSAPNLMPAITIGTLTKWTESLENIAASAVGLFQIMHQILRHISRRLTTKGNNDETA